MECATGSLLPEQARVGKPPVAPKLYQYPKFKVRSSKFKVHQIVVNIRFDVLKLWRVFDRQLEISNLKFQI